MLEDLVRVLGIRCCDVLDVRADPVGFEQLLRRRLSANDLSVIIARKPCLLAAAKIREYEQRERTFSCPTCATPPDAAPAHASN